MTLQRNHRRESTYQSKNIQWWSESFSLFGLHVYTIDGEEWNWKINAITSWNSDRDYGSRDEAYQAARNHIQVALESDLKRVLGATS